VSFRVFVTGGAGYVGSHCAKALVKAGHEVLIWDDLSTGFERLARFGSFRKGSILDSVSLTEALRAFAPDLVMHFAAKSLVGESVEKPALYYQNNVIGSLRLLEAICSLEALPAFVFSSTCSIYGDSSEPLTEGAEIAPSNPYANSKAMIEAILRDYSKAYGLRSVSLRYFNAAGCDPDGELGELHEPETHLIPRILLHCKYPSRYPLAIYGDDYPTLDGSCVRDYVHVTDLAAAHLAAVEYLSAGGADVAINLGSTRGYSVKEVISAASRVTGVALAPSIEPRREGDPPFLVAGSGLAGELLRWHPKLGLEEMLHTAWNWVKAER
jgi:UDP-glucose-4-epimerase GalE